MLDFVLQVASQLKYFADWLTNTWLWYHTQQPFIWIAKLLGRYAGWAGIIVGLLLIVIFVLSFVFIHPKKTSQKWIYGCSMALSIVFILYCTMQSSYVGTACSSVQATEVGPFSTPKHNSKRQVLGELMMIDNKAKRNKTNASLADQQIMHSVYQPRTKKQALRYLGGNGDEFYFVDDIKTQIYKSDQAPAQNTETNYVQKQYIGQNLFGWNNYYSNLTYQTLYTAPQPDMLLQQDLNQDDVIERNPMEVTVR